MEDELSNESDDRRLTALIQRAAQEQGDAKETLYAQVYSELRAIAHRFMNRQRRSDLQTTALVNEVVLRFEKGDALNSIDNRRVFFSVAVRAMNQILIDHHRRAKKRVDSPDRVAEPLDLAVKSIENQLGVDFERLQNALGALQRESPRQHAVITHRFFGGLSIRETAAMLNVSVQTVERDWRLARAKLFRRLKED